MTEQLVNATVTPSATLVTASITAGTTSTFSVSWTEASPPTTGTYSLIFRGASNTGSDDSIFRVATMSSATVIATGSWEKVGAQATFDAGCEIDLDHSKAALQQVISDHDAGTTQHASATNLVQISGAQTLTGLKRTPTGTSVTAIGLEIGEANTGFRRVTAGQMRAVVNGVDMWSATTSVVTMLQGFAINGPFKYPRRRLTASSYTFATAGENFLQVLARSTGDVDVFLPRLTGSMSHYYRFVDPSNLMAANNINFYTWGDQGYGASPIIEYDTLNQIAPDVAANATIATDGAVYDLFVDGENYDPIFSGGNSAGQNWTLTRIN